ncbi:hypothetical protein D3C81_2062100 [compost metagenome]
MVFHHFGLDQIRLPFDLKRHPRGRAQRPNVTHLSSVVIFQLMFGQRHLMRAEQHVVVVAQQQAVRIAEEVINEIAGRVFVDVAR